MPKLQDYSVTLIIKSFYLKDFSIKIILFVNCKNQLKSLKRYMYIMIRMHPPNHVMYYMSMIMIFPEVFNFLVLHNITFCR